MDHKVLKALILDEFQKMAYLRAEFPMLTGWGCPTDTVHSMGLNYLTALGRHFGFWAISEYPVPNLTNLRVARAVRSDVAWFARPEGEVKLLCEFERYDPSAGGKIKLREKVENLVIAHHQLSRLQPRILLLIVWTTAGVAITGLTELVFKVRQGFWDNKGNKIPSLPQDSEFIAASFVFSQSSKGLLFFEEVLL